MGVKLMPALVVFHSPPDAVATYHVLLSVGCTAMSRMRPEITPGPIERNLSPPSAPASGSFFDVSVGVAGDAGGRGREPRPWAGKPVIVVASRNVARDARRNARMVQPLVVECRLDRRRETTVACGLASVPTQPLPRPLSRMRERGGGEVKRTGIPAAPCRARGSSRPPGRRS